MGSSRNDKRSKVPGGAEDELIENVPGMDDPTISSRAKDAAFADEPRQAEDKDERASAPTPAPSTAPPERHESGGPYDEEAADASFFKADYNAEETNRKGGDDQ